jgi:type III restriction enzyme
MLHTALKKLTAQWLANPACSTVDLLKYMRQQGRLRETQIQAIEIYLFLKIEGNNQPLGQLFARGFFNSRPDLDKLNINHHAREYLRANPAAFALFDFVRAKNGAPALVPALEARILEAPDQIDYQRIIQSIFYGVNYADYLMSLPMGAGKTWLMAAFMYLDLYFATKEPDNKAFAHNFLVLAPSGLKSSIIPSLKTIQNFDPAWILPEPDATDLRNQLKFDVLDESKSAKKSNQTRNPNAQKISQCLPNPFAHVFVVNAEKVILNTVDFEAQAQLDTEDGTQRKTGNDLRELIGQIPNLSILIDEVHHAATDDIKLRQAVNYWSSTCHITTVLGFSGTPYLAKAEEIVVRSGSLEFAFKFREITSTVYYYPLVTAIATFLKTPKVKIAQNLSRLEIIRQGVQDFQLQYGSRRYQNGCIAKQAIYCSDIATLEEQIYPFLTTTLGIPESEILKFHGGNVHYSCPAQNEVEFRTLDLPSSTKRFILLVQVGKEGWDCPSLSSVILSQKGDSPKNMVLQTACRCLRQVDKRADDTQPETALIWLNQDNADTLNAQLKQEQNSSIEAINSITRGGDAVFIPRLSRMDVLQLPPVDFFQMKIAYEALHEDADAKTSEKLERLGQAINNQSNNYYQAALVRTGELTRLEDATLQTQAHSGFNAASSSAWLRLIGKESFELITRSELEQHQVVLGRIFNNITSIGDQKTGAVSTHRVFNEQYDQDLIRSHIRLAFSVTRQLHTRVDTVPQSAQLLLAEKLGSVPDSASLYPPARARQAIAALDAAPDATNDTDTEIAASHSPITLPADAELQAAWQKACDAMPEAFRKFAPSFEQFKREHEAEASEGLPVQHRMSSFHYSPYNFGGSGASNFELKTLQMLFKLPAFQTLDLEIYYNGERGLSEFVIQCYKQTAVQGGKAYWKNIGKYTTDFLVVQREATTGQTTKRSKVQKLKKVLLLETKGKAWANDEDFKDKKHFVETEFLRINAQKFGFPQFDFFYLQDDATEAEHVGSIERKLQTFFAN